MSEQPFWWHDEEAWRARNDALREGRGPESRGPAAGEDVPTLRELRDQGDA